MEAISIRPVRKDDVPFLLEFIKLHAKFEKEPDAVNLTRLDLRANKIGSDGVEALARSPYLCNLNELDLRSNDIDDAGIRSLIESTTLDRLTQLRVTYQGHDKKKRFRADLKRKLVARFGPGVCRFD